MRRMSIECDELHVEFMNRRARAGRTARLNAQVFETRDFSVADEPEVLGVFVTCVTLRVPCGVETLYNNKNAAQRESSGIAAYLGRAQRLARYLQPLHTGTVRNFESRFA